MARFAVDSTQAKRLITVLGVGLITAVAFLAQVGEIDRSQSPRELASCRTFLEREVVSDA